jgi:hypothetical protein
LNRFPPGTADYVTHKVLGDYIRDTAVTTGVQEVTQYNTNVRRVWKSGGLWTVETTTLRTDDTGVFKLEESSHVSILMTTPITQLMLAQDVDAVVVASGHYQTARVPSTPGLADWKRRWPDRVQHSKSYRRPDYSQSKVSKTYAVKTPYLQPQTEPVPELSNHWWKCISNGYCARTRPLFKQDIPKPKEWHIRSSC